MKNKSTSIPVGMLTKKFDCHKCGERLSKHPKTRIVKRGDPDYKKYNHIGHTHIIGSGDVEVTEYDFQCPSCGNITEYGEQCVIEKIQKKLDKAILSEGEILDHKAAAKEQIDKKAKIFHILFIAITCAVAALILYFAIKSGDFSFTFYF